MIRAEQCAVIIPCCNEAETILPLVREVRRLLPNIIVVDDGSVDATRAQAEAGGAECFSHTHRQGKGAALLAGFQRARERNFSWALTMDGDGQHSPADISKFFAHAEETGADLVIGNRMGQSREMPLVRRITNQAMSRWLSLQCGQRTPDSQCGFRLINLRAFANKDLQTRHFEIESELLLHFAQRGKRIGFVPIEVIYKKERSKISPALDAWRWLRWIANSSSAFPRRQQNSGAVIQRHAGI